MYSSEPPPQCHGLGNTLYGYKVCSHTILHLVVYHFEPGDGDAATIAEQVRNPQ
jgi:hypothetical protein